MTERVRGTFTTNFTEPDFAISLLIGTAAPIAWPTHFGEAVRVRLPSLASSSYATTDEMRRCLERPSL